MLTTNHFEPNAEALHDVSVEHAMHVGFIGCPLETPLREVARLMSEHRVHCIVGFGDVTEDDTCLWGIVSDVDLVSALASGASSSTSAGEIATTEIATIRPHESLHHAAQLMRDHRTSHLLVLDACSDRPLGVLSTLDIAARVADEHPGNGWLRREECLPTRAANIPPGARPRRVARRAAKS